MGFKQLFKKVQTFRRKYDAFKSTTVTNVLVLTNSAAHVCPDKLFMIC